MNLPMILSKVCNTARSAGASGLLIAKKHVPEILVGTGIAGYGLSIISACKSTAKAHDILQDRDAAIDFIKAEVGDEADHEQRIKTVKKTTRNRLIRAYIPTVTMAAASTACVLGGYGIIRGRFVATAAAYKALEAGFDQYRSNVIDEFGKDVDWRMRNNIKHEDLAAAREEQDQNREIEADNKQKKIGKKRPRTDYEKIYSEIFDKESERWRRSWTPTQVLDYLRFVESELNDKLQLQKHLFLNEVYDRLGMRRTAQGAVVGWIITQTHPKSKVDFGLDDIPEDALRAFLSETYNDNIWIRLQFHPDGIIYNMIDNVYPKIARGTQPIGLY